MKLQSIIYASAIACMALLASCGGTKTDQGEKARESYTRSLEDSIKNIEVQIDSCKSQISILRNHISTWMTDFTTVANPREVGSYKILTSWRNKYPLTSTGIVARINDSDGFEIVAALSGKAFNRITVQGPSVTASTDVVPHDQALNYTSGSLTTVMFTGEAADSVGQLIANNELNPLTVIFENGAPVQSLKLASGNARMISYTYALYKATSDLQNLERRVPMLNEKIKLIREHKDR